MKVSALIEKDISTRTQKALNEQNMAWVELAVDGRDITLTGIAPSEAAKMAADKIARVYGYNILHNRLEVKPISSSPNLNQLNNTEIKQQHANKNTPPQEIRKKQAENCQKKFNHILKTPLHFKSSSSIIEKASFSVLDKIALTARECVNFNLKIHGHTDSSGSSQLNKKLSHGRAKAVMKYLINKKIDDKRLTALGHGASTPIASNKKEVGRAKNRRIEITVEDKQ